MTGTARAFWVTGPARGEIRSMPLPPPGRGEVSVRAIVSGISRGTESLVFQGRVPASERQRMRCPFQEGEFPSPVKYGYASVGVIDALGPEAPADLLGQRVFCLYPHQDRYVVPTSPEGPHHPFCHLRKDYREQRPLGSGRGLPRGRQSGAQRARRAQPGAPAAYRAQLAAPGADRALWHQSQAPQGWLG